MLDSLRQAWAYVAPREPHAPAPSTSRAGRNLKAAVPTALIALAIVGGAIVVSPVLFAVLVCLALCIGQWEVAGAFLANGVRIPVGITWLATVAMVGTTWLCGPTWALFTFMVFSFLLFIYKMAGGEKHSAEHALASIFALGWVSFLGCFAVATAGLDNRLWPLLSLILMPVASDTGGWLFGILWGKHPLAPSISPKKSWEGALGSLVGTALFSVLLWRVAMHAPWWLVILVAFLAMAIATVGDLSESLLKRELGVKDMGVLFPGHGGMLDRLDSILMWAPVNFLTAAALM